MEQVHTWWGNLLWRRLTFHPCKYSILIFTVSVLILSDQASYLSNIYLEHVI
jgi:hypothetical protein